MSLEQIFYLTQIAASAGVITSLIFVGLQLRQSTAALQRGEHNSTMEQWTAIRMGISLNRDVAELITGGLDGTKPLDAADQLRVDMLLNEYTWASFHIWDRTRRGVFPPGTFELSCDWWLSRVLRTPVGAKWWKTAPTNAGLIPPFVADVNAMLASHRPIAIA